MTQSQSRRSILIMAGASALALSPLAALAGRRKLWRWQGVALGAEAMMLLDIDDGQRAARLTERAMREIDRLESIFSLYRPDSALSRLNRDGGLDAPPPELLTVLALSGRLWRESDGAFDPSVQPLWRHHAEGGAAEDLPDVLARIGFDGMRLSPRRLSFARPGMALTLNGIAQGYITDRIADLLRAEGLDHSLIELGETRALGLRPDGAPWRVRIEGTDNSLPLEDLALAVSQGGGALLPTGGNHILDPKSGGSANPSLTVAVTAPRAMLADGLSTALCLLPESKRAALLAAFPDCEAFVFGGMG